MLYHFLFQILDAYSAGTTAFKGMVSAYDLTPENVDKVMDDVNEVQSLTFIKVGSNLILNMIR